VEPQLPKQNPRCSLELCPLFLQYIKKNRFMHVLSQHEKETVDQNLSAKTVLRNCKNANKVA